MAQSEFYYGDNPNYPKVVQAISETVLYHIISLLYSEEAKVDLVKATNSHLVRADLSGGSDFSLHEAAKFFQAVNVPFPFTAYGFGDQELNTDQSNIYAANGMYHSSIHQKYMHATPMKMSLPMISFFSNGEDFQHAYTLLMDDKVVLTRLNVPIILNNVETFFTIDVDLDLSRGSYAGAFQEYLRVNKIWDIVHTAQIKYYNLFIDSDIVYPVDNIVMSLKRIEDNSLVSMLTAPDSPNLVSIVPSNNAVNIAVTSNITITFSTAMDEKSVENAFSIFPYATGWFSWNIDSTVATYHPYVNLDSSTKYTITLKTTAQTIDYQNLESEIVSIFTTT